MSAADPTAGRPASALATNSAFETWAPLFEGIVDGPPGFRGDYGALDVERLVG